MPEKTTKSKICNVNISNLNHKLNKSRKSTCNEDFSCHHCSKLLQWLGFWEFVTSYKPSFNRKKKQEKPGQQIYWTRSRARWDNVENPGLNQVNIIPPQQNLQKTKPGQKWCYYSETNPQQNAKCELNNTNGWLKLCIKTITGY